MFIKKSPGISETGTKLESRFSDQKKIQKQFQKM